MNDNKNESVMSVELNSENNKGEILSSLSDEFERDSRRYNKAFTEEREVGAV